MLNASIAGLAILKVNWERGQSDYLQNFVPLVIECLRESKAEIVSLPELQQYIRTRFGIDLPLNPLRGVLQRAKKEGYLRLENKIFYVNQVLIQQSNFRELEQKVSKIHDNVVGRLRVYARDKFQMEWNDQEAEDALVGFLGSDDTSVLFASYEGSPLQVAADSKSTRYVVSSFVYDAQTTDERLFEDLETLAKGSILATALFLPDPGRTAQRFKNTVVYLDTTFLIFAAGYAGPDREAPARELIELLHKFGADLRCLSITLEEIRGILDACASVVRRGQTATAYGPTMEYFIQKGYSSSDIDLLSARLPEKLKFMWILVDEPPPYEPAFVIDERGFEEHLKKEIGYRNRDALIHDVNCVAAVARLRRGKESHAVETSRALFVTTNGELAKQARRFFQRDALLGAVPLCLTDHSLGNLLWLKNPTAAPNLPRKLLIADAYAALQPSDELWKSYLAEISRLQEQGEITETDYYLLRYSIASKRAVMDITQGMEEAFTEGTVAEVLAIAQASVRADLENALETETSRRKDAEQELASRDAQMSALIEQHDRELRRIAEHQSVRDEIMRERLVLAARSMASYIMLVPRAVIYIGIFVGALYAFPWGLPSLEVAWFRYGVFAFLLLLFIFTVAGATEGISVKHVFARLEERLADSLARKLIWLQGPTDPPAGDDVLGSPEAASRRLPPPA